MQPVALLGMYGSCGAVPRARNCELEVVLSVVLSVPASDGLPTGRKSKR